MFVKKEYDDFKDAVSKGLKDSPQKNLPSKYLYDTSGSYLFELITQQPEYYPTRTESQILQHYADKITSHIQNDIVLIELGSGSSTKTKYLFEEILKKQEKLFYFPIDISFSYLNEIVSNLSNSTEKIIIKGIPDDYINGIKNCNKLLFENNFNFDRISRLYVFFGSSIGNFETDEALNFLKSVRVNISNNDFLLVGFDLVKEKSILEAAYNDKAGITSQFNLNILKRINRELSANFNLNNFFHTAIYNQKMQRIEMHIVSKCNQKVSILELNDSFEFSQDETIHTENSYKYDETRIKSLANRSGFSIETVYSDPNKWFNLVLFKPI